ncbi:maleylacetoacetate isomerase [Lichenihabitans sp. Uapishka_5]|uniref:maleylacetoacetate isomerase n=1 Tax=Lichenihabitans sp. Uapishka_5 TaxID=3037302 RepID=UPI0029E7E81F|nr:maleylacetoacetate isomerase [Lichenihabitans sp. Uapishka_5]MDX7950979.1 maleylacetoacetate isomerase [Lichenihabitans sp. Uapishka_5]
MTDTPRFLLYAFWRTSAAYRVRVALALKGLAWEERFVDNDKGENRSPDFLRLNPLGGLPVLIDRMGDTPDGVLTQSLAILDYLEEAAPEPALLSTGAFGRARVRSIAAMAAADTHPLITPRIKKYLTGPGGFDDAAWRAWQEHWFTTGLQAIETRLASDAETGTFCHGDRVTMADVCLASLIVVMRVFKISVPEIPTIDRIMARCEAIEAFARAEPMRQQGAPA